jgi:hypothetical protein
VRRGVVLGLGVGVAAVVWRARRRGGAGDQAPEPAASAQTGEARHGATPTRAELYREAQRLGIPGRSRMTKRELEQALDEHQETVAA